MFPKVQDPPIILSIGGALIAPDQIDGAFLEKLNLFIRQHVARGRRFFLVAGGGKTARYYRDAGKTVIGDMTNDDLDWLGIHATRLNAHLLRTIFQDIAHPRIIENYDKKLTNWKESVVIGAGWKPGWSTDYDAVMLACDYGANLIVNLSNIDWVYDKDPRKFPDAVPIQKMTWEEFEDLVGTTWTPGMNAPFDPVAAQLAKKHKLTAIITNGGDFANLDHLIEGDSFKGTVITPFRIDAGYYDREYYKGNKKVNRIGSVEGVFGRFFSFLATIYRALLIKLYINPKKALDVGCGTGDLIRALRFLGVDAHGVEISKDALALTPEDVRKYIQLGDIVKLPYEDNSFDLVFTFDVLEHIERGKLHDAINETVRVSSKLILHKMYTRENLWITWFHRPDFSQISIFGKQYWRNLLSKHHNVEVLSNMVLRLPSFFETIFLLRKKA